MEVVLFPQDAIPARNAGVVSSRQACLELLARTLEAQVRPDPKGVIKKTAVPDISIIRSNHATSTKSQMSRPTIWITLQGATTVIREKQHLSYSPGEAFLLMAGSGCSCTVHASSAGNPYLGLCVELDYAHSREIADRLGLLRKSAISSDRSDISALDLSLPLLQCLLRTISLLESPKAVQILQQSLLREICYWLQSGPGGRQLAQRLFTAGQGIRASDAVRHLHANFSNPVCVDDLADLVCMSPATLHRQFKLLTSLSPHQYLKRLRLLEARRLLFGGKTNVKSVAFQVGYLSASHFSREYARLFGQPPGQKEVKHRGARILQDQQMAEVED
ncbi:Transcriptional regulator, AraC family [Acidisarcina polymorpha]|uniref:Transcriptional regulator, AraC family n=1 Tax=Acidisarcina polymorpha TaxID=2211140 RepID=A0A2Z5FYE2_9BACT|nr:Transcriptional regulator, AraC family [Acidisarcina polymorpha]